MRYPGGGLREQLAHVGAEAVRAGLVVTAGDPGRVPKVLARFLETASLGEASV